MIYELSTKIKLSEENEKAGQEFLKQLADDLRAIFEARAAVIGKDKAAKEMNEALNNWSAAMAIQKSPW